MAFALVALAIAACGEKEPLLPDATPPGQVTDLRVKSAAINVVTLRWTTPGDNGTQGTASSYQIRWSPTVITESNFAAAHAIPDPPVPAAPGTIELFSVPNMDITQSIHFALRTFDEVGQISPVSNDAYWAPTGLPVQLLTEIPALADNTIFSEDTTLSNGAGQYLFAGRTGGGFDRRALLAFAVTDSIPADAVIDSVRLMVHMSATTAGARTVSLHRLLADWGEGTSDAPGDEEAGAPAQTDDATWSFRFFNSSEWNNRGGDYDSTASAQATIVEPGFYSWKSAGLRDDVQHWLAVPDSTFGWTMLGTEGGLSVKRFDSRENATPAYRPRLKVYYTVIP